MILEFSPLNSYIASALETAEGAFLSNAPKVFEEFGLPAKYEWKKDLSLADLSRALEQGNAIVSVKRRAEIFGHALVY